MDLRSFALNLIQQNPNIRNNPNAQEMIRVIESNDAQRGQQLASNLCTSMGVSQKDAVAQAQRFFRL